MKLSGKGILIMILFLILIPAGASFCTEALVNDPHAEKFSIVQFAIGSYGKLLLLYLFVYLPVAFGIIYLFRNHRY